LTNEQFDWRIWTAIGAAAAVAAGAMISQWLRRPPDPDETERKRRSYVNQIGRIVEGHVVELIDATAPLAGEQEESHGGARLRRKPIAVEHDRKLVRYSYSISGVSYETAQDLTGLENRVPFDRLVSGQPASVKYDPAHPANSILLAEDWCGLH
jgi:hypothetical protein